MPSDPLAHHLYTEERVCRILAKVADGHSLRKTLREESIPGCLLWYEWMRASPELQKRYAQAKDDAADSLVDEIREAIDADPKTDDIGKIDPGDVAHRRLKVDSLKWVASKLKPKVYGDRISTEHSGKDGGPVIMRVISGVPEGDDDQPGTGGVLGI